MQNRGGDNLTASFLLRKTIGLAVFALAALQSPGETAKWKVNNAGDMSDAANWVDGYIPQAGDTLDFSVITATYKGIVPISDDVQYETMTGFTVSLSRSNAARLWNFKYINSPGCGTSGFNFYGNAHLNVEGKITYTGNNSYFISDTSSDSGGAGGVTADEFEYTGPKGKHIIRAPHTTWGGIRARRFIHNGTGENLFLSSDYKASNNQFLIARYIVGSGGFTFGDTQANTASRYYYIALENTWARTVRIDPYADYTFAANPTRTDNMALSMSGQCSLELGTSDFDDPSVPRRVTCVGGIGGYLSNTTADKMTITVDGCGFLFFNAPSGGARFPGTIKVKDTATLVLKDTATTSQGPMTFDPGTTLNAVQTLATGTVELGGTATFSADSVILLDFAAASTAIPLRLNGLTPPASGTIKLKIFNNPGAKCTLIDNLPAGTALGCFAFAEKPYVGAKLYIENGQLKMKPSGLVVVVR